MTERSRSPRVVVVGGGISGLAAAHRVLELEPSAEVTLLEGGTRVGGLLSTEHHDGFVIEHGPDAILTEKPWAIDLARRLGLEGEIVRTRPEYGGAYLVVNGKLERVPDGFSLLAPGRVRAFVRSPVLSPFGKARALMDVALPRRKALDADESLESFVVRRFGREVFERLAQPLVGGIYGADPAELSLASTMPRFLDMERQHRSLVLALRRKHRAHVNELASGARYGQFVSFRHGNGTFVDALAQRLEGRVRLGAHATSIIRTEAGYRVGVRDREPMTADVVVVALPAWAAAPVVATLDPSLGGRLLGIPYGSSAAVVFAWNEADIPHPLDAYGFVVPLVEGRRIMASTWASRKWPNRAPDGRALLRVFLGGVGHEHLVDLDDAELARIARGELRDLLGVRAEPLLTRVDRYRRAIPHYTLGHRERVLAIEDRVASHPGLFLAGNAYHGVGIPDSVKSGERAGEDAVLWFAERARENASR
ncbi:MAG: protoporphyrinogen oxidase [Myxococcales bacterium]|nr:protoporphyrinogen oxidase [Myxococcales bacterium]